MERSARRQEISKTPGRACRASARPPDAENRFHRAPVKAGRARDLLAQCIDRRIGEVEGGQLIAAQQSANVAAQLNAGEVLVEQIGQLGHHLVFCVPEACPG